MNWRELLREEHRRRLDQIENYENSVGAGYRLDSDQSLVYQLARELDRQSDMFDLWRNRYTPWWLRMIHRQSRHAYTCRLFRRVDYLLLWFRFKHPHWHNGRLFVGRGEANTIFPDSWYAWAANTQNQKIWTRLILNL